MKGLKEKNTKKGQKEMQTKRKKHVCPQLSFLFSLSPCKYFCQIFFLNCKERSVEQKGRQHKEVLVDAVDDHCIQ